MIPYPYAGWCVLFAILGIAGGGFIVFLGAADAEGRSGSAVLAGLVTFALAVVLLVYSLISLIWG